jgi:hypothetical protein
MSDDLRRLMAEMADGAPVGMSPEAVRRAAERRIAGTAAAGATAVLVLGVLAAAVLQGTSPTETLTPLPVATAPTASASAGPTSTAAAIPSASPTPGATGSPSPQPGQSAASNPPATSAPLAAGSTIGIDESAKTIRVVLHGAQAGAAGARTYWESGGPNGGPRRAHGYRVVVDHLGDGHSGAEAAGDCEGAARTSFLLVSVAAAEQSRACAQSQQLRRDGVPYIALGGADTGLGGPNHFASSLTFRQQAPLLLDMARDNGFLSTKWAVVVFGDAASTTDARAAVVAELTDAGVAGRAGAFDEARDVYALDRNASNCSSVSNQLRQAGYGSVHFVGASPLLQGLCVRDYPTPVYTGVGSTPLRSAGDVSCRGSAGQFRGFYLNPTPDPQRAQALAQAAPALEEAEVEGWAAMQMLHQALNLVDGPLGRASLIRALAGSGTSGGVLHPTAYDGRTRFGGTAAYANRITCPGGNSQITTVGTYRR